MDHRSREEHPRRDNDKAAATGNTRGHRIIDGPGVHGRVVSDRTVCRDQLGCGATTSRMSNRSGRVWKPGIPVEVVMAQVMAGQPGVLILIGGPSEKTLHQNQHHRC